MAIRYTLYLLLGMLKFMLFSYFTKTDLSLHLTLMNLAGMLILSSWTLLIRGINAAGFGSVYCSRTVFCSLPTCGTTVTSRTSSPSRSSHR